MSMMLFFACTISERLKHLFCIFTYSVSYKDKNNL